MHLILNQILYYRKCLQLAENTFLIDAIHFAPVLPSFAQLRITQNFTLFFVCSPVSQVKCCWHEIFFFMSSALAVHIWQLFSPMHTGPICFVSCCMSCVDEAKRWFQTKDVHLHMHEDAPSRCTSLVSLQTQKQEVAFCFFK